MEIRRIKTMRTLWVETRWTNLKAISEEGSLWSNLVKINDRSKRKKNPNKKALQQILPSFRLCAYIWAPAVPSNMATPLNATVCAADSRCQEAEAAREKLSSPQGVTAFIIITNLQAPPEPTGVRALPSGLSKSSASTFHHSALEGWKELS